MSIHIHNSLTRKKEELVPLSAPQIKIYTCGPTVYDEPHIGHARSAYIFDIIRRYLEYKKYDVKFVRNITDVDDKIIDKARKEFRGEELNSAVAKVSKKYLGAYQEDMKSLGIREPDVEPKVTEYVSKDNPAIQRFIELLIERGAAYVCQGDVYFDITKAKDYGKLSGQSIEKMETGYRVALEEKKKNPLDFALWKAAKEDEPYWESPWGKGMPGWHIECSAMSSAILGDEFDIHGGGLDLIFPHHENEIAQSEGAGKKFAKYWIHHGLLTINGQKMSKSLGNFITIKDFIKQEGSYKLKLFFLSAHYHSPLDYNENAIHIASENAQTLGLFLKEIKNYEKDTKKYYKEAADFKQRFINAMDDDFNTSVALSILLEMVSTGYKNIAQNNIDAALSISNTLAGFLNIFGVEEIQQIYQSLGPSNGEIVNALVNLQPKYKDNFVEYGIEPAAIINKYDEMGNQEKLIASFVNLRNAAKQKKDFNLADKIRDDLSRAKVILEDTRSGKTIPRIRL